MSFRKAARHWLYVVFVPSWIRRPAVVDDFGNLQTVDVNRAAHSLLT